jgi:hypothetical protein
MTQSRHDKMMARFADNKKALRKALAQPEQEPVGEVLNERGEIDYISYVPLVGTHLYATPPAAQPEQVDCPRCGHVCSQRPWQGLTDDEITEIYEMGLGVRASIETALDKIEERNT